MCRDFIHLFSKPLYNLIFVRYLTKQCAGFLSAAGTSQLSVIFQSKRFLGRQYDLCPAQTFYDKDMRYYLNLLKDPSSKNELIIISQIKFDTKHAIFLHVSSAKFLLEKLKEVKQVIDYSGIEEVDADGFLYQSNFKAIESYNEPNEEVCYMLQLNPPNKEIRCCSLILWKLFRGKDYKHFMMIHENGLLYLIKALEAHLNFYDEWKKSGISNGE